MVMGLVVLGKRRRMVVRGLAVVGGFSILGFNFFFVTFFPFFVFASEWRAEVAR